MIVFRLIKMEESYMKVSYLKVIIGNSDRNTAEGRILDEPIIARYVRIHPMTWNGRICMRVELFGCREGMLLITISFTLGIWQSHQFVTNSTEVPFRFRCDPFCYSVILCT